MKSAWTALRADKELLGLPVLGGLVSLVALAPVVVAMVLIPSDAAWLYYVVGVLAVFVVAIISTFFAVALAAGAHERMNGGNPTFASSCAVAWRHRRGVVGWALLTTTVGLVLNAIENRLKGAGGFIVRLVGDLAWAVASFFTIPIIATHDVGPIEALKLSAKTFGARWSSAVRVQVRLGLYGLGLAVLAVIGVVLVVGAWQVSPVLGVVLAIPVAAAVMGGLLLLNAVGSYSRVALYRYASGMPTPGFATAALEAAVVPSRRAR